MRNAISCWGTRFKSLDGQVGKEPKFFLLAFPRLMKLALHPLEGDSSLCCWCAGLGETD
jgi:hypothetical protein